MINGDAVGIINSRIASAAAKDDDNYFFLNCVGEVYDRELRVVDDQVFLIQFDKNHIDKHQLSFIKAYSRYVKIESEGIVRSLVKTSSRPTCMDFPWIGLENGIVQNLRTREIFHLGPISCIQKKERFVIAGHLDGKVSVNGLTILNLQSPVSSLLLILPFLLIGLGNGRNR